MIRGYMSFRCNDCNNTFRALDIEYGATAMSVPIPCPNCNSRHTYPPNWRLLSFYPFGNNREVYKKRSGKEWKKRKASVKANKLTCDWYSFGKTTSQVSVGLGFSSRDIVIMYLRRILAYPFFVFSLLYFIIILLFPIKSLHLCHVWWVLYKPLAIHCTKLANEVIRPG